MLIEEVKIGQLLYSGETLRNYVVIQIVESTRDLKRHIYVAHLDGSCSEIKCLSYTNQSQWFYYYKDAVHCKHISLKAKLKTFEKVYKEYINKEQI